MAQNESTVNSEIFVRILFLRTVLKDIKKSQLGHNFPISVNDKSDFIISRGFYFHETSHMQSFAKIKTP